MTGAGVIDLAAERARRLAPHAVRRERCVGCGYECIVVVPISFFEERRGRGSECARCHRMLMTFVDRFGEASRAT